MGRAVLVTGVAADLPRRFARRLAKEDGVDRVVGVDVTPPRGDVGAMQFVRADIRNPVIAKVVVREQVDTVVHLSVSASSPTGGRQSMKEPNVIGTMQLLAACQQSPDVRHLVVKSSAAVYGATNRDPAMFTEDMHARRLPRSGFPKDVSDVEAYVRGFGRRRPDVRVTTLRMADILGPRVVSRATDYFRLPVLPTVLGFDPRLQFLHERDAREALRHATLADVPGVFNIAGDGILMLSQVVRRLGRPTMPLPAVALAPLSSVFRHAGLAEFPPERVAYLTYGRGMDTSRMRTVLGFHPRWTSAETLADFAESLTRGMLDPGRIRAAECAVAGALGVTPRPQGDWLEAVQGYGQEEEHA
ncbi:MAG TPA: NAD-dependent epimerase/dehydratase family protein [Marmoricola sp.]|jgi:UDP-glucose 4-epimerase